MRLSRLAVLLLLAGCGSSPKTHFYTLVPEPPARTASGSVWRGPPLQVGHVTVPGALDRLEVVTGAAGTSVKVSEQDRWIAPLDELVRRALTADLRQRIGDTQVLAFGDPAVPKVRTVALHVQTFSVDANGKLALSADWTVGTSGGNRPASVHHATIQVDAAEADAAATAAAMSKALGLLADKIVAELNATGQAGT